MNNKLRTALIIMISTVWAVNFTAAVFVRGYKPPSEINVPFMVVVGTLTATYDKRGGGKGGGRSGGRHSAD